MEAFDKDAQAAIQKLDDKGFVADAARNAFFRKLRMKNENRTCFECAGRNPTWISITYGVYLCLDCSGEHRRKGVHLSFVRSVEMDKFTPEQLAQMACGGNGKAWAFFKQLGMGKLSDAGRPIDYSSKNAVRYKQQLEKDTQELCAKLNIVGKNEESSPSGAEPMPAVAEPQPVSGAPSPADAPAQSVAPAPAAVGTPAPAPVSAAKAAPKPASTVVRKAAPVNATATTAPSPNAPASKPQSAGASGDGKAKKMDFDFDFDEIEREASRPTPAPVAAPAAPTPTKPAATPKPAEAAPAGDMSKYSNRKGISSDDFFGKDEHESAVARLERENKYESLAGAGAISSDAFFGGGANDRNSGGKQSGRFW